MIFALKNARCLIFFCDLSIYTTLVILIENGHVFARFLKSKVFVTFFEKVVTFT